MPELDADFEISTNNLEAEYEITQSDHFDCSFEIFASGTTWGAITGNIENQLDLQEQFSTKADVSTVETLSETVATNTSNITDIQNTIDTYGNIVTFDSTDFATAQQGELAESSLQPNDNITELNNNAGYITTSALEGYATETELTNGLAEKQDTIDDLTDIRSNAENGQSAYTTIQNYGDVVTYNASDFATASQGQLADSSLQPNDNITELNNNAGYITSASLPTVNNNKITIQKNSTDVGSFTLNQSSDKTINISVPTQASDINAVPNTRTVNNKALSSNITLNSTDVGALSSSTTINDLTTSTQQDALNSGATSTNIGQITTNTNNIADINDLIPTQATTTNQLADKSFVNSSIATNTANFIGTFNSVAELEAYSGTLTNNDYAFVETTDSAGNTLFDRYKYTTATTPASWQFEYELNNSSFTSNQWASINSGITSNDVTLIGTAIQPNDNITELNNNAGYITSSSLPTVNDGTLTIQQNGTDIQTFKANQSSNATANITVPTDTNDLTNGAGYITGITSTDVTNALGYTPYDSSNPNSYTSNVGTVTSVNNVSPVSGNVTLSIPTDTSDLTNGAGYITGINSSDVTTALGYTPYDSSNPSGYTTNVGTVTSVNNTLPDANGNVTISTGSSTDVQINGTSITSGGVANILTYSAYNSSTNKIATMSDLPDDEIFVAEYNTTTYQEVLNAYNSGKMIYCKRILSNGPYYFSLVQFTSNGTFVFTNARWYYIGNLELSESNGWSGVTTYQLQQTDTAVTHTASTAVGSSTTPVYVNSSGVATASTSTIGGSSTPVYLNAGTITSTGLSIEKSRFDGQWTAKETSLTTSTAVNTYTLDLVNYLPVGGGKYEVLVACNITSNNTSPSNTRLYSDIISISTNYLNQKTPNTSHSLQAGCLLILPVTRYLYFKIENHATASTSITAVGYRRIGTNT